MSREPMPDLEPLVCIGCVTIVEPLSDEAEGWVLVQRSVDEDDDHDDQVWKCPTCATAGDEYFAEQLQREVFDHASADDDD